MKKDIFLGLSKQVLIEAGTYFPSFVDLSVVKDKLDEVDLGLILEKKQEYNALDNKKKLIELISKYFDLDKYGDLTQLSNLEWVTQLRVRKKILALLNQSNNSNHRDQLQFIIFELFREPILSSEEFGPKLSTKNINDLTIEELYSIFKPYQNNGTFDLIESNYNVIGPDLDGTFTSEDYHLVNTISKPIDTPNILDNKFKVVATIDLSISNSQLMKEFAAFLENKRDELDLKPIVDEFKNKDKVSLIKHNVLQYLDLLVLTRYVDPVDKLINAKYATFLFPSTHPDYDKAYGKFNDSTLKYADKVLNGDTIQKLLSSVNKQQAPSFGGI